MVPLRSWTWFDCGVAYRDRPARTTADVLARVPEPLARIWPPRHQPRPTRRRVAEGTPIALAMAAAFRITTIVAVGRKVQGSLVRNAVQAIPLRHPAQGGARIFATQLVQLDEEAQSET